MTHNTVLPIGITMGDAAGIGPEIILKSFVAGLPYPAVVYGDALILKQQAKDLGIALPIISIASPRDIPDKGIGVLNRWQPLPAITYGQVQAEAGL